MLAEGGLWGGRAVAQPCAAPRVVRPAERQLLRPSPAPSAGALCRSGAAGRVLSAFRRLLGAPSAGAAPADLRLKARWGESLCFLVMDGVGSVIDDSGTLGEISEMTQRPLPQASQPFRTINLVASR